MIQSLNGHYCKIITKIGIRFKWVVMARFKNQGVN